jgi:hypothetical protein
MPEKATSGHFLPIATRRGAVLFALAWTVLALGSLFLQRAQLNRTAAELARVAAIASLKKDMAIRDWASSVEGVFVREKHASQLASLDQEQRLKATDRAGEPFDLVLVTPMHLLLAIQDMSNQASGGRERLTSRQLRNPANVPDDWERKALAELEKGASVVTDAMPQRNGHGLMRVMIPMKMEEECLQCHRDTLVPVGGLRGGAAVSVDLNAYFAAQEPAWRAIQAWHGGIWLFGLAMLGLSHRAAKGRASELARQNQTQRENAIAFAAMAEGAAITDSDAAILWVNDAFAISPAIRARKPSAPIRASSNRDGTTRRSTGGCGRACAKMAAGTAKSGTSARPAKSTPKKCPSSRCVTTAATCGAISRSSPTSRNARKSSRNWRITANTCVN